MKRARLTPQAIEGFGNDVHALKAAQSPQSVSVKFGCLRDATSTVVLTLSLLSYEDVDLHLSKACVAPPPADAPSISMAASPYVQAAVFASVPLTLMFALGLVFRYTDSGRRNPVQWYGEAEKVGELEAAAPGGRGVGSRSLA